MGKFVKPRVQEYTFVNLEQMICDICDEFDSGSEVEIAVTSDESAGVIMALMATGKFKPYIIDYDAADYLDEYAIFLTHNDGDDEIYINKAKLGNGRYVCGEPYLTDVVFISDSVKEKLRSQYETEGHNIVLYNIED